MKNVKIFISKDEEELKNDGKQIELLAAQLTKIYKDKIYFNCIVFNNNDELKKIYIDEIKNSDVVYILIAKNFDEFLESNFNIAYNTFLKNNSPKIFIYLKKEFENNQADNLLKFKQDLGKHYKHYYGYYSNIDSLKLDIVLSIKKLDLDELDVDFTAEGLFISGNRILDTKKLPMFLNNNENRQLRQKLLDVENQYLEIELKYKNDVQNLELRRQLDILSRERNTIKNKLKLNEDNAINCIKKMFDDISTNDVSEKQIRAYHKLEEGEVEEAIEILDYDQILVEAEFYSRCITSNNNELKIRVNELLQLISAYKASNITPQIIDNIDNLYKKVIFYDDKYALNIDYYNDYAIFLMEQNRYNQSMIYTKKGIEYYKNDKNNEIPFMISLKLLGSLYFKLQNYEKSLEVYLQFESKMIEIMEEKNELSLIEKQLVISNDIPNIYCKLKQFDKAENLYLKNIEYINSLTDKNNFNFYCSLSTAYNNLASLYVKLQRYQDSEKYYKLSLELLSEYQEKYNDDIQIKINLAKCLSNLANLYFHNEEYLKSELYLNKSIEIFERFYLNNPEVIVFPLAFSYSNLAKLYFKIKNYDESETLYLKSINLLEEEFKINDKNENKVEVNFLCKNYNDVAYLYYKRNNVQNAEYYVEKCKKINNLLDKNVFENKSVLAMTYYLDGMLKITNKNQFLGKKSLEKSISLLKNLVSAQPLHYKKILEKIVYTYNNIK